MAQFDLNEVVSALAQDGSNWKVLLARALQRIQDGFNNLGQQTGAEPIGFSQTPPTIEGINVKTAGETVHVMLTHNAPINKGIRYFVEYTQNDPSFGQPFVEDLGTSRHRVLSLPTNLDGGSAVHYYFRGYPQMPGSQPSKPVNYGGITPTAVTLGGSTNLTLIPSTGSGTAAANGQQGGYGIGRTNTRRALGPKRLIPA